MPDAFEVREGDAYARRSDGAVAVKVAGLPLDLFFAVIRSVANRHGDPNPRCRLARPSDGLGEESWYVITPSSVESPPKPLSTGEFAKETGWMCAWHSDGSLAVNVAGMPQSVVADLGEAVAEYFEDPDLRIQFVDPTHDLGAGEWVRFKPRSSA